MKINQFQIPPNTGVASTPKPNKSGKGNFAEVLKKSVDSVNELQSQADAAINDLATGKSKDVAQTIIMMEKADISFRLMMQVRNKIMQAYEEVMRMQV